jgi:hypothetical protein
MRLGTWNLFLEESELVPGNKVILEIIGVLKVL